MKTSPVAAGIAFGVFWAIGITGVTVIAMISGGGAVGEYAGYGSEFIKFVASVYPGYSISAPGVFIGILWSLGDGFVSAAVLVWLYNFFACLLGGEKDVKHCASPDKMHVRM